MLLVKFIENCMSFDLTTNPVTLLTYSVTIKLASFITYGTWMSSLLCTFGLVIADGYAFIVYFQQDSVILAMSRQKQVFVNVT